MLAAAAYAGFKLDFASDYVHRETNKLPAYTSKFPFGQIPALEGPDGFYLSETTAILKYSESLISCKTPIVLSR